jgi:hypothetical protein
MRLQYTNPPSQQTRLSCDAANTARLTFPISLFKYV